MTSPHADLSGLNASVIEEFRANGGRLGGRFAGVPVLLLHSTGARTGTPRVNPVAYQRLGPHAVAVFASRGGAPRHPDWYHNLVAHPAARVELGTATVDVVARVADPAERTPIWERQKAASAAFADYERRTTRTIPVVVLEGAGLDVPDAVPPPRTGPPARG